jgi:hypothetical protein
MMIPPMRQYQLSTSLNIAADVASTSCNSSKLISFPTKKKPTKSASLPDDLVEANRTDG